MEIIHKNPKDLINYDKNNKKHSSKQVDLIANSIQQFGFNQPIVIDKNNVIIVGHGRIMASLKLDLPEVPCLIKEDLTEAQIRAYRVADNKLSDMAEWDEANLITEIELLKADGFDLTSVGLDDFTSVKKNDDPEVPEDEFEPKDQKEIFIELGDVIELGQHRLICGDSTEDEVYQKLFAEQKADLIVTDPPYGVSYADKNKFLNKLDNGHRIQKEIANDHIKGNDLFVFFSDVFLTADQYLSDKASYYLFSASGNEMMVMMLAIDTIWQLKHQLIWVKNNHVLGMSDYSYKHEPILYGWRKDKTHNFYGGFQTSTFDFAKPNKNDLHPTMKPIPLIAQLISNSSKEGDIVLDTFLGSGTALIACESLKRKCYGIEIDPKYCQVIIDRYVSYCEKNNKPAEIFINGTPYIKN